MAAKNDVKPVDDLKTTPTPSNVYGSAKSEVKPVDDLKTTTTPSNFYGKDSGNKLRIGANTTGATGKPMNTKKAAIKITTKR